MSDRLRIGVFGGTFDPIHNTHLDIAREAQRTLGLERVLFVVAGSPPHKQDETEADPETRLAMVDAALAETPGFDTSRIELDRDGPSYTVDTVRALAETFPGAELFLIIGEDSLIDFPHWRNPEEILAHVHLVVVPRPDLDRPVHDQLDGNYTYLPFVKSTLSSSGLRERLARGESVNGCIPEAALRIIRDKGLYGAHHQE